MSLSALTIPAQEAGLNHWIVGGLALAILLSLMAGLLMFGAGREHS